MARVELAMMISAVTRYETALTLMQSAASLQTQLSQKARPDSLLPGQPAGTSPTRPKDMKVVNDYYFGSHLTSTQVMFHLFERLVGHLNEQLDVGRDGDEAAVKKGNEWREKALLDDIKVGSERDFSLPRPGEDGFSFRRVAQMIKSTFNLGALSQDRDLMMALEQSLGFRLTGMSIGDLIEAVIDPEGPAHERVADVLERGLAGQAGSKVMQRLEEATEGPKSVEETLAAQKPDPMDVVDEETIEEDRQAISNAKAREKLEEVQDRQDRLKELHEKAREAAPGDRPGSGDTDLAMRIIQALAADGAPEIETSGEEAGEPEGDALAAVDPEADETQSPAAGQELSDLLSTIIRAYREDGGGEERDDDEPRFSMLM